MTVLVSAVNQMMAPEWPVRCGRSRIHRRHLRCARRACGDCGHPCTGLPAQGQDHDRAAHPAHCQRRAQAALDTDFDGCMRIVQEVTRDNSIYLANSMNFKAVEGQKTVGIEIVQQLRLDVLDWIILPSGNLGNISAGEGAGPGAGAGGHRLAAPAGCRAGAAGQPAVPGLPPRLTGWSRRPRARRPHPPSASATRPATRRAARALRDFDGVRGTGQRRRAGGCAVLRPGRVVHRPAHGRAGGRLRKPAAACTIQPGQRAVVIPTSTAQVQRVQGGLSRGDAADVVARHRNPPVELPAQRRPRSRRRLCGWLSG